ncbi:hypothetical protein [Polymorphobacter sp.]|uniref:hypothetical protein n=1 Tax=Polymorphobacter sp. TaxID=1909290 RepID=UPI003F710478
MSGYSDRLSSERRRSILALLVQDSGRGNERVLFQALRSLGLGTGLEQAGVREQLQWLAARDCLTTRMFDDTMMVAEITDRGRLVADGSLSIDGIAPPSAVM